MRGWDFPVKLDSASGLAIYLQIAKAVTDDIRRGRLAAGDPLPGTRRLARTLRVHRNTVLAAYNELAMEGWVTTSPKRATFVARDLPETRVRQMQGSGSNRLGFDLSETTAARALAGCVDDRSGFPIDRRPDLGLWSGLPDVRLLPVTALGRAYSRALRMSWRSSLMYSGPEGHPKLRAALATLLATTRGLAASADSILVTRGSQMGVWLVAQALVAPDDVIAVEDLGYRVAWEAFRMAGARLVSVPVDEHGLRVDRVRELMATERLRAIYVTPQHQFPTTVTLSTERRELLLKLAAVHRCAIIEDDYDHEFHYEGRPVLPLAAADKAGVVIYIGTLSKVLAPGLRTGFVVAPGALHERLATIRSYVDLQGDQCLEYAIAELLEDGEIQRHVARMRRVYRTRRDALVAALHRELADALTFTPGPGGTCLWARVSEDIDVEEWRECARLAGVAMSTGQRYDFQRRPIPFVRLGFTSMHEREIEESVRRMARCRRTARRVLVQPDPRWSA
jgi:GntR family transcriptional regulator/MocR family aminotransferase